MDIVYDDLIRYAENGNCDIVFHVANCFHTMGAGVAGVIARAWPEVYASDVENSIAGDIHKLGEWTVAAVELNPNDTLLVYNLYAQYEPGKRFEYLAFRQALESMFADIFQNFDDVDVLIAFPKVGSGIGGGAWDVISTIIEEVNEDYDYRLTLVIK